MSGLPAELLAWHHAEADQITRASGGEELRRDICEPSARAEGHGAIEEFAELFASEFARGAFAVLRERVADGADSGQRRGHHGAGALTFGLDIGSGAKGDQLFRDLGKLGEKRVALGDEGEALQLLTSGRPAPQFIEGMKLYCHLISLGADLPLAEGLAMERRVVRDMGSKEERDDFRERSMTNDAVYAGIFSPQKTTAR